MAQSEEGSLFHGGNDGAVLIRIEVDMGCLGRYSQHFLVSQERPGEEREKQDQKDDAAADYSFWL